MPPRSNTVRIDGLLQLAGALILAILPAGCTVPPKGPVAHAADAAGSHALGEVAQGRTVNPKSGLSQPSLEDGHQPTGKPTTLRNESSTEPKLIAQVSHETPGASSAATVPPDVDSVLRAPQASENESDGDPITVDELEQLALANNPTLQQAEAVICKAVGVRRQVGLYPNPTIGYFGAEMGDNGTAGIQGGFIAQTIVTGGKLAQSQVVANQEVRHLQWQLQAQQYRVRNEVRSQFYETLGAQRQVAIAQQLLEIAQEGVSAAQQLLDAQQTARPDLLQARIQLNEVQILLRNVQYEYEAAWTQLASLVGQPDMPIRMLAGGLDDEVQPVGDFEAAFAELLARSPEVQAAESRVSRARAQIDRQVIDPIPNLVAQVNVAHNNASGDELANVQLGLPLPIFNRNQGNIQLANAEYNRAVSDLRRVELALRSRWAAAMRDYRKARNQVRQYRDDILPTAKENLQLTEEGYEQGQFDLIRALTARQSYFEASLAQVSSQVALRRAEVALSGLLLTGGLDDVPDSTGTNLEGVGLRGQALSGQ